VSNTHDPEESRPPDPGESAPAPGPDDSDERATPVGGGPQPTVPFTPEDIQSLGADVASDPDDPLVGTLLRNKWRVLGRIGSGSFGTVYKVRDVNGEWIEALKILSVDRMRGPDAEQMRKRFLREAQIMKRLGSLSPHIVGLSTYEDDLEAGLIYFLMEHVEGRVLSEVLLAEGALDIGRAVRIGLQVCDALIAAHGSEEPIIHRDLKLENVMLTTDREGRELVKVLDFGIAKIAEQDVDSRLTGAGTLGTPGYAAPEQLRAGEVDGRTDLFAFGVILYSLVTGRNPWLGHLAYQPTNQTYELMSASDQGKVIPISTTGVDVPPAMVAIIMRLLQRDPDDRYQSARELRDALEAVAESVESEPGQPTQQGSAILRTPDTQPQRRLAAVWFADLVGYSTLSSQDEEAALALLDQFHKTARRVIEAGGGRVVQFIGDAAFAEFSSTQRAVGTAQDFIDAFAADTEEYGPAAQLRIGVHVGDVLMAADGDVFGDGVNVAARIQSEAEPGQILVSQDVWRQLRQRRDFAFVPVGERALKGIGAPVTLFAVAAAGDVTTTGELDGMSDPTTGLPTYPGTVSKEAPSGRGRRVAAGIAVLLAVGAGGYAVVSQGTDPLSVVEQNGSTVTPPDPEVIRTGSDVGTPDSGPAPDSGAGTDGTASADAEQETTSDTRATTEDRQPEPPPLPPSERVDPLEPPYRARLATVTSVRDSARASLHPGARDLLLLAEASWNQAIVDGGAERFQAAIAELDRAEPRFRSVMAASSSLREVDAQLATFGALRDAAWDQDLVAEAERLVDEAESAAADHRFEDAFRLIGEARSVFTDAARPRTTPEPPPPTPDEIAADVLARLEGAIDAQDIARVRSVWPTEVQRFQEIFARSRVVDVAFDIRGVQPNGGRVIVSVLQTYVIDGYSESLDQQFDLAQDASGSWIVIGNRLPAPL
jgi:serine/threonine protein kinase